MNVSGFGGLPVAANVGAARARLDFVFVNYACMYSSHGRHIA